jgi:hypothetical protein
MTALRLRLKLHLRSLVLWAIGLEEEDRRELVGLVTRERTRVMRNNTGVGLSADRPCSGWYRDRDGRLTSASWDDGVCWTLERGFFRESRP